MQNMHLYNMNDKPIGNRGEIIIYRAEDNTVQLAVRMENETVWLTASQMAMLFDRDVKTIRKHINNALREELDKSLVVANFASTKKYGRREGFTQQKEEIIYNLDVIISVGYRVKSQRGVQFRQWANRILKDYLVKGFAVNEKLRREQLSDLRQLVQIVGRTVQSKAVESVDETQAIFDVVLDYTYALDTLDNYDYERLTVKETTPEERFHATYENAMQTIAALREKFGGSTLFGNEKDDSFKSSIGQIYQTFGGKDLYPSVEEKAAMLLYLVTKNHSFSDGNKRIAATLFLWFLNNNGILYREDGTKRLADNTLVALTLMIAESRTEEKDTMVKVVVNLIGAGVWSMQIKANSEGNKFLQMFPYWVIAYGVSLALLCPVAFFSIWEHNIDFILMCVVLSIALVFALLIIAAFVVAIIKKQYRNAGRIVGIGVLLIIYTFIVSLFAGMGEGAFDNFGKRHPIPEGMEYEETNVAEGWYSCFRTQQEWEWNLSLYGIFTSDG